MSKFKQLEKIGFNLDLLEGLYDSYQLVQPKQSDQQVDCVGFWYDGELVDICISDEAYQTNKTFTKILKQENQVFLVTAIPFIEDGSKKVLEFYKDITSTGVMHLSDQHKGNVVKVINDLHYHIEKDPLTDAYKGNVSFLKLQKLIDQANESKQPLSLIFISVNHVAELNQAFSNDAGNYMLKQVARLLLPYCVLPDDFLSRIHGLRYFLVLNNTSKKKAYSITRDINKKALRSKVYFENQTVKMSLNIGFHTVFNQDISADQFYRLAQSNVLINHTLSEDTLVLKNKGKFSQIELLTIRENEVAELLINGLSNIEIATQLYVSESTVKKHIASIYHKLHLKSRAEFISSYTRGAI